MNTDQTPSATAVVFVETSPEHYRLSVQSLLDRTDLPIVVGVLYPIFGSEFSSLGDRVTLRTVGSVSQLINETYAQTQSHIVVVADAVSLPPEPFAVAERWMADDIRIASVTMLCNAADFVSFPNRNVPETRPPDGHDETSITRRLRSSAPAATPVPIMFSPGPVVVLNGAALGAVGEIVAPASARFDVAIADFCARARAKGFVDVIDTSTYVSRTADSAVHPLDDTITPDDRGWLLHRHQSLVEFVDRERTDPESPFGIAHRVARVKLQGLRVLIDGSCFGPNEVGTQVATQHTIRALAAHPDVAEVAVALPGPIPAYASTWLTGSKIRTFRLEDMHTYGRADVAYRPYQPTPGWDAARWRDASPRLVIAVLDTIAFHNGGYFASSGEWLAYRDTLRSAVRAADAVTVISDDVITQMRMHGFVIGDVRLHSIPLGTEHLRSDNNGVKPSGIANSVLEERFPDELAARGFTSGAFALCLGVNYTHKNREIARAAHELVRADGHEIALVLAGASVPYGTTRVAEARHATKDHVFVLPEMTSPEKQWLLRHASFVWYPTSAEGFGLVPFEAAVCGTPTVAVDFGPLHELILRDVKPGTDAALLAKDWSARSLADVAITLLRDPARAVAQTEAVAQAGEQYSWSRTASSLVTLFRDILAIPRR